MRIVLIADDLADGPAGYAREGQRQIERYLAKVAAFQNFLLLRDAAAKLVK